MKVCVTGAAGFIGGHACQHLLEQGYHVRGVDNFDPFYDRRIKEQSIEQLSAFAGFEFVNGDVRDFATCDSVTSGMDVIVHLAARAGVRPSIENPRLYSEINVLGTVNLLQACVKNTVTRFVFGSSSSVYGNSSPVPFQEESVAVHPISPYAASKRSAEHFCDVYWHLYNMRIASLRFFTVYGPRQRPDLAIYKFTRQIWNDETITQFGDGSSERDYTHVTDIVRGVTEAVRWSTKGDPVHEVFNLGGSRTVKLRSLVELLSKEIGKEPHIRVVEDQPGDVRRTWADITKAQTVLGYRPEKSIEHGIREFVQWYGETYGSKSRTITGTG